MRPANCVEGSAAFAARGQESREFQPEDSPCSEVQQVFSIVG